MEALAGSGINKLIVILVILGLIESAIGGTKNLAFNKPTNQSSTHGGMASGRAVDGIKTGDPNDTKISHTERISNQWWEVDLGQVFYINAIVLYNKQGHPELLNASHLLTSLSATDSPSLSSPVWIQRFYASENIPENRTVTFSPAIPARYVAVFKASGGVLLREVEVFGAVNLALNKKADQSSTESNMVAGNAVDGMTSDVNKVSKTEADTDQWWRVDLGDVYYVTKVVVYNSVSATDISIMTSLSQTDPFRSSQLWIQRSNRSVAISNVTQVPFWPAVPARFVALFRSSQGGISLREVEVFGFKNPQDVINLALNQAAAQSSTSEQYNASLGVNGNRSDFTHTRSAPGGTPRWFRVDLGGIYQVESVILYNRKDCCRGRLRNFTIGTSDDSTAPSNLQSPVTECYYKQHTVESSLYVTCVPRRARYVIIYTEHSDSSNDENVLSLAEVEVYEEGVGGSTKVTATHVNASCVQITWQQVSYLQGEYQVKCGNGGWERTAETTIDICESNLTGPVACSVRAEIAGGFTMETTDIACTAPSPPNCTLNETASGASSVNLQIICLVLTTNCHPVFGIRVQAIKVLDHTTKDCHPVTNTEEMQRTLTCDNLDPVTTYMLHVTSTNQKDLTSSMNLTYTTMELAPDNPPEGYTVLPFNTSCLSLRWSPPSKPNGNITEYQVNCYELQKGSSASTNQTVASGVISALRVCDFSAGSRVNCSVMARNSAGLSPAAVMITRTNCTVPSQPQLTIRNETESTNVKIRIKLSVGWQIDSLNCDNISIVCLEIERSPSGNNKTICTLQQSANGAYEISDLDSYTNYTLTIHAWNNENFSSSNSKVYTTPELAPYDGPTEAAAFPVNSTCISLTWKQPENPNGRIIEYQVNCYELQKGSSTSQSQNVTSSVHLSSQFCNFSAGSHVNCSMIARNSAGLSPAAVMTTRTNCTNPSQPQFSISNSTETIGSRMRINLSISWQYSCTSGHNNSTTGLQAQICDLQARMHVSCNVSACTTAGCGPTANQTARTNCTAPSALTVEIMNEIDYKLGFHQRLQWNVTWNVEEANCDSITFIRIDVTNSSGSLVSTSKIEAQPEGSTLIEEMLAFTNYTVTFTAVNNENMKNSSRITKLSKELAPDDPPQNMTIRPINGSCVMVKWEEPRYPNGLIIQYNVTCINKNNRSHMTVSESSLGNLAKELCGFPSGQKVHCSVLSQTRGGYGPEGNGSGFTHLEVRTLPQLEIMSGANKVILRRAELLSKVNITAYHVVMNRKLQAAFRFKRELVYENITLLNYDEAKELKQSEYIAAAIKLTDFTKGEYELELGDNKLYNGYRNIPLDQPEYMIRTGFCVQVKADENCMYSGEEVIYKVFREHTPDQGPATEIAIGTSIAGLALLILAAVGLGFFMRRRQKPTKESDAVELSTVDKTDKNMKRLTSVTNASQKTSSVRKYEELQTPLRNASNQKERYDQLTLPSKSDNVGEPDQTEAVTYERVSECIPLDRLEAYVENGEKRIFSQYEVLPDKPSGEMISACIPENRGKSRYKGLYPVDEFRVRLLEPAPSRTDFINASFIEGVSEDKAYIAAQGPMAATLDDFWNMIWQERPSAIVMVTKCWEDGKAKCEQYWPDKQGSVMEFGNITVQLSSEELWASFGMRSLKVTKAGKSFTFKQFQYFGWPDHGVPVEIASFVTFYRKVKAYSKMIKKALLVHCSAGVGRTGTFIAMDYLLNQATAFNMVDPFECVMAMRKRRPSMIQTKEQYLFLHKVVLEALSTEKFCCNPVELGKRIAAFGSSLEIDMITQEFQHMEMVVEKTEMQFEAGKLLSNKGRNRIEDILPHDAYRPFLTGTNGDYINAIFVNSHKEKEKMVATQLPLVNTVQDFWQLIHDQKSVTIIQLRAADEPYYPEQNQTMKLKSGLLSNTGFEKQDHFQLVHLTQKTAENSEKKVLLYQFFGWKSKHLPDTDSFLALFEHLQKYQQQTDSHKIIVTCGDGATRCGMFICAFNVIERLRMEQEVDVYNEVLLARLRRPQFVSTSQQYLSLYKILNKYVDGFSEYSNFT